MACNFTGFEKQIIMNIEKLEMVIEQLERVHRDMNDCANRFILKDAINQIEEQVKLFAIPAVVGRSEQLKADLYGFRDMWC